MDWIIRIRKVIIIVIYSLRGLMRVERGGYIYVIDGEEEKKGN
jgi:hypothetical protein